MSIELALAGLLDHRVKTAWRAISVLRSAESALALAGPPFLPPSRPRDTALGFFMNKRMTGFS
jgi:hypothetical protein